ncbi:DNA-binding transcriptional LysR family regulator [Nonomuraea fuscirosea]|uniref:DNA-binding transcriptional LysR family regulator n=1 Tax=Nonomuraea fuscirosea TaxID=1291556 RepID=A0A2T0MSD6_9ACTN|nr:LysR family transcriptional regulator [Nonomuraea fuscirosea]PRX61362.1 DNA-binding transcriptional LysR family regulator [Nonomuraea fuscirosea]
MEVMTIDEVVAFVAVAEWGGFTEASRRLNLSQPAVSRRIRELERSVGVPLFERAGRRVRLTGAGRALLPYAETVLATVRDAERAVREQAARPGGSRTFGLAIVGTLADSHIVDALRAFESRHEDVFVELTTASSRQVSALVRTGEASLGLRYFADADPRLESIPLGAERLAVVVPAAHPVTAGRLPDLGELRGERWLGFSPERGQPDSFGALLDRLLPAGAPVTRVDSLTAQKRLVQAGLGVALMPTSSVREELRLGSLRAIEIDGLDARLPVVVIRRGRGHRGPLVEAFLEALHEHTPSLR